MFLLSHVPYSPIMSIFPAPLEFLHLFPCSPEIIVPMFYMVKKKLGLKYQENSAPFRFVRSDKKLKGQEKIDFLLIKVNRSDSQDKFLPLSSYRTAKIKSNY